MSSKSFTIVGCVALAEMLGAATCAYAQEGAAAAENAAAGDAQQVNEVPQVNDALQAEIKYAEALVDYALPDFAQTVIDAAKAKWPGPEADTQFFAIEIRAHLSLGEFEKAEAKIAALPDRNGSKYWAARLEMANNFFAQGKKKDCSDIYDEFFKRYPTPPKELRNFYLQASYAYGQILLGDKQLAKAAERYEGLLKLLDKTKSEDDANTWCNVACEAVEIYLRLANDAAKPADRKPILDKAKVLVDQLLWEQERPVYFGRAIAFLAHVELLKGDVGKAQATIDDYMDQLAELHKSIVECDPEGRLGLLRQSPMPQCRYMLAEMLWNEAQAEAKKPNKDDERVKALMFGQIVSGKKRNGQGAYNHALNVFVQYPESAWAAKAGDMEKAIAEFAVKTYGAKIQSKVTPEQMEKVRSMQFKGAREKAAEGDYEGAIADFYTALAGYPEGKESIQAIEGLLSAYRNLLLRRKDDPKAADWRIDMDAIEGYLSERFGGAKDTTVMTMAGDATLRAAAAEKERGEISRADALQKAFLSNYRRHVNASNLAASLAGEAQKNEKWADAISLWSLYGKYYPKGNYYAASLSSLAHCYEKTGDRAKSIEALKKYVEAETNPLRKAQAQMNLAMTYQKNGFEIIDSADTNEVAEAVSKQIALGSAQIVKGIKEFQDFAKLADEKLADPGVQAKDKERYSELKEGALFLAGDSWRRLKKPESNLEAFRNRAVDCLESYVKQFPKGQYAPRAYVQLGTLYTALGNVDGSRNALDRLAKEFPDAKETRDAKPRLARSLIEMGMDREGADIYAEMLRTDGAYVASDFLHAGDALIKARNWELANQAFEKAISKAGTNQWTTVARARIGQATSLYRQKSYAEARDAIDAILDHEKLKKLAAAADANFLLIDVASTQGLAEKNPTIRGKHFGAAMGALKRLRNNYWSKKPQEERDKLDLMSAEIRFRRANAEDEMGQADAARDTRANAAATLQVFLQTRAPTAENPLDKMNATQVDNLERAYTMLVPALASLGGDKLGFVLKFGQDYLDQFPNGKARTEVLNCINQAKAAGAVLTDEAKAAAEAPAADAQAAAEEDSQPVENIAVEEETAETETSEGE